MAIRLSIDTIEDLQASFNKILFNNFFEYLEKLIEAGYEIDLYRINNKNGLYTSIKDLNHLNNFKKTYAIPG